MFHSFQKGIQETFKWKESDFDSFLSKWESVLKQSIKDRSHLFYSKDYFQSLLVLFFILKQQQDLGIPRFEEDSDAILLLLLTFYLTSDISLQILSKDALGKLTDFYRDLYNSSLISLGTFRKVSNYILFFEANETPMFSDITSTKTIFLIFDFLSYSDPVLVNSKAAMFYYGEPLKTMFKYRKEDSALLKPEMFFDRCFAVSQRINNIFIKQMYTDNYHHLMEVHSKHNIIKF